MMNVIRPISDLRRPEEVNLRKDAARQYGKPEAELVEKSTEGARNGAVVEVGDAARRSLSAAPEDTGPQPPESRPPLQKSSSSVEVIERAIGSFGLQQEGEAQGLESPALPLTERPDQAVPFDILQRAAAAQDAPSTEDAENLLVETRLGDERSGDSAPPRQTAFTVPDGAGEPFGRDVPFDLTELGAPALSGSAPAGSAALNGTEEAIDPDPVALVDQQIVSDPAAPAEEATQRESAPSEREAFAQSALSRARTQLATEQYRAAPSADPGSVPLQTELLTGKPLGPGFELAV